MKVSKIRKGIVLVAAASALALGCELIVDFDRTLIKNEDETGPAKDAARDAVLDAFKPDTNAVDAADAADAADAFDADDGNDGSPI